MSTNRESNGAKSNLRIVNSHLEFPQVSLKSPVDSNYVHLAAELDDPLLPSLPFYVTESEKKRAFIADCKNLCEQLVEEDGVVDATVFKAIAIPPGRGAYLKRTDKDVHVARFDVTVLIEVENETALGELSAHEAYSELESAFKERSREYHITSAINAKRIDSVSHASDGVFLFNYFFAEDVERNLDVWEYTAGWFEAETGLDNSTLLLPKDPDRSEYTVINHCRWDSLLDVLPALLFKPTFRKYVLKNFEVNDVAAMPILYKLA